MNQHYPQPTDTDLMLRCLQLAERAKGHTSPNPMVGAVLVHDGRVISEGWHQLHGAAHAEVNCLDNVGEQDKALIPQSTMYVNLEPCAHYGLTPPCAARLVQERIKQVVIANGDPYDEVKGKGIEILEAGGVEVITGLCAANGLWMNRRFFCFHQQKRPYIILKWAKTPEGFMAPIDRSRFQITNEMSTMLSHKWRTEEAAIMVGYQTGLIDNPQLTARLWKGRQPLRIVTDRNLELPPQRHLLGNAAATWVVNEQKELQSGNVRFVQLPFDDLLLQNLLTRLHDARMLSVIIEGGAAMLQSFIKLGLWDEARILTGSNHLGDGLPAPLLSNANHAFSQPIGTDELQVFVNQNSRYPYVAGMAL